MSDVRLSIAIFGSWREPKDQEINEAVQGGRQGYRHSLSRDAFEVACRQLGHELAALGHRVFVASDSPSTIDYHLAQGIAEYADHLALQYRPIALIRSRARRSSKGDEDCTGIHAALLANRPELFEPPTLLSTSKWEEVHDYIAEHADSVLILGGGASSHRIAVRALATGKLVVPVGAFGGAGEEVSKMLENIRDDRNFPKYEYRKTLASGSWTDAQLNTTLYALGVKSDPTRRYKIFVNYRRSDSNVSAGWIYKELCGAFSKDAVFLDTKSLYGGDHFDSTIVSTLKVTKIFIAIIGPNWLKVQDAQTGQRRLDAPRDFVRREIEIAMKDRLRVIPVCVEGAEIPAAASLPATIAKLIEHNVHVVHPDKLEEDITDLVALIKRLMNDDPEEG